MFSRTHGPKKPLFVRKESKFTQAKKRPVTRALRSRLRIKAKEREMANLRIMRDWYKDCGYYFNRMEFCDDPGAVPLGEETKRTCPHEGNEDPFSSFFCKPDCERNTPFEASVGPCIIKCNSSAPGSNEGQKASKDLEMMRVPYGIENLFGMFCNPDCKGSAPLARTYKIPERWECGPPGLDWY